MAGCWVHAKRKFSEYIKAVGTKTAEGTIAEQTADRISELFHLDNKFDGLPKAEKEQQRQRILKKKVDQFFEWSKKAILKLPPESTTAKGLQYCINQEKYLRVFLSNGDVPMDNNRAERAIRPFTLGRKNWVNMFSENGAESSAVIYSIVETAKANNLRVFEYLEYLLTELMNHADDTDRDFIKDLLHWSEAVQEKCHSLKKT